MVGQIPSAGLDWDTPGDATKNPEERMMRVW